MTVSDRSEQQSLARLKISVALATCNRASFLKEQLCSIAAQDRLPDEMIIADDCSTDRTIDVISDFARHVPFPVHWWVNGRNQGYSDNLEHAIQLCSGDLIVLCDDDDICLPGRLGMTERQFERCGSIGLMICNSALVDDKLNPLGVTLWDTARFACGQTEAVLEDPIGTLARHFIAAGHVMAFRECLKPYCLPFPRQLPAGIFCDVWIALVLASVTSVVCVPQAVVAHRLHSGQIAGVRSLMSSKKRREVRAKDRQRIAEFMPLLEGAISRVSASVDTPLAQRNLKSLRRWAEHMKMQLELPQAKRRRLWRISRALLVGEYHRYSRGCLTAARDLLLLH